MKKIFLISLLSFCYSYSQTNNEPHYNKEELKELELYFIEENKKAEERIASFLLNNPEVKRKYTKEGVEYGMYDIDERGNPLYNKTYNWGNSGAVQTARAQHLNTGGSLGLDLNGEGMTVGVWDGGPVLATHTELTGRVLNLNSGSASAHATHVTGTIIATGLNPALKSAAPQATALSYDWDNDISEMTAAVAVYDLLVSNHSYGPDMEASPMWLFGAYDSRARSIDQLANSAPYLLMVTAAGNDRDSYATLNPTKAGYEMVAGFNTAKNFLTVGAVNGVSNYTSPNSVVMSGFSNWGPTDDGRIKPDLVTKGVNVISTMPTNNTASGSMNGTSMASPGVASVALLLQQHYHNLFSNYMRAATLKGLLLHTTDEAGLFDGPDYRFGWGLINAKTAAETLTDINLQRSIVDELILNNTESYSISVYSDGSTPLEASISWTDPHSTQINTGTTDPTTLYLINDLDLRIFKNGVENFPWTLDPSFPISPATRDADNFRDNYEKVKIDSPESGFYTITVSHKGNLQGSSQPYSLIVTGIDDALNNIDSLNPTSIKLYPNPTTDLLYFDTTGDLSLDKVEVYDTIGKRVLSSQINNNSVDVSQLTAGVYFVKIYSGENQTTKKIIKK